MIPMWKVRELADKV